jgi:uncharacterized membrane protein YgaE (UPF0421/DUF939 family)
VQRLRSGGLAVLQAAGAAGVAWFLATAVLGYQRPFFACVTAIIAFGTTVGQRSRRAVEIVVGVAVGVAVADLIVLVIGTGTIQLIVVVAIAMAAALLVGASPLLVNQAGVSAILVVTLQPPTQGVLTFDRFLHALVGGAVALVFSQLLFPIHPLVTVLRASYPVFRGLADALDTTAQALRVGDHALAIQALLDARALDPQVRTLEDALAVGQETARLAPAHRGARGQLDAYTEAARQLDLAVRNTRVLARAALDLLDDVRHDDLPIHGELGAAVEALAEAVRALGRHWEHPQQASQVRRFAVDAARRANGLLEGYRVDLEPLMVVGQIRSTAVDLLRGSGMDLTAAQRAVDQGW